MEAALVENFVKISDRVMMIAQDFGETFNVYSNQALEEFITHPISKQQEIVSYLEQFLNALNKTKDALERTKNMGEIVPINDRIQKHLTMYALWEMGLEAPDDFLRTIGDDDIVEVYDKNIVQIYRNIKMSLLSNYSLIDLMMYRVDKLFSRPEFINALIFKRFFEAVDGNKTMPWRIPEHEICEIGTIEKRVFKINFKYVAPVKSIITGEIVGGITCQTATRVYLQ